MELKISDLPDQFEYMAKIIGIDNMKLLIKEFGGTTLYFPTEKKIYKSARDRQIISEFNGLNYKYLAIKYDMSESYIRSIVNNFRSK